MVREDGEAGQQQAHGPARQQRPAQRAPVVRVARRALQQPRHHAERQRAQRAAARVAHRDAACTPQG